MIRLAFLWLLAGGLISCCCLFSLPWAQQETYKVTNVIDGDTIILENGERVRYIGVDAPETHHPEKPVECFGREATQRNQELVEGQYVTLESDQSDRDQYSRLLRYVYVNDIFVNATLIEEGFAYSYYYPPDTKHYQDLVNLELQAKEDNLGLWAACAAD